MMELSWCRLRLALELSRSPSVVLVFFGRCKAWTLEMTTEVEIHENDSHHISFAGISYR